MTGIAAAVPGCGDETSSGDTSKAGESGSAGKDAGAGDNSGGSSVKPSAGAGGEGGVVETHGGTGGAPEGGVSSAGAGAGGVAGGAGGVANGGAGGEGGDAPACTVPSTFGAKGLVPGIAAEFGEESSGAAWEGELPGPVAFTTELRVELYDGYAPFDPVRTTLTNHVLAGPDLNYATCGLCLRVVQTQGANAKVYFATGGTVTLTNVVGRVKGSASNLTFEEVTIEDDYTSTPVPGGCKTAITSISFDESTGEGGAGGGGGAGN